MWSTVVWSLKTLLSPLVMILCALLRQRLETWHRPDGRTDPVLLYLRCRLEVQYSTVCGSSEESFWWILLLHELLGHINQWRRRQSYRVTIDYLIANSIYRGSEKRKRERERERERQRERINISATARANIISQLTRTEIERCQVILMMMTFRYVDTARRRHHRYRYTSLHHVAMLLQFFCLLSLTTNKFRFENRVFLFHFPFGCLSRHVLYIRFFLLN